MAGYIFGGNTGETPESIARKRAIAAALLKGNNRQPQNVGEAVGQGLSGLGNALVYRALMGEADKGEAAGKESAAADFAPLLSGGSPTPTVPMTSAAGEVAATSPTTGDTYSPFMDTVKEGGLTNPYGLAAVAATGRAESGWSAANANRTWSDPSESGKPGTAGGIMSWRGPRYEALAATGDLSPQGQAKFFLQEDPQLIAKLNNAKSLEEAQQLMNNAWAFAGYDRPGGESSRRLSYAQGYLPSFQGRTGGNVEVASLDPSAGMSAADAIDAAATPSGYVDPSVNAQNAQPAPAPAFDAGRFGPRMNLAEMPPTRADIPAQMGTQTAALTGGRSPVAAALASDAPAPQQPSPVAQALSSTPENLTVTQQLDQSKPQTVAQALASEKPNSGSEYFPPAPSPAGQPSMQQIMKVLNNPYSSESQKDYANYLLTQMQKQNDPAYKLQQEYQQARIDALNKKASGAGGEEWGLNPVWGKDKDGKTVLGQVSKTGKFKPLDTGDFQPTPGVDKVDTGTAIQTRDSKTGVVIDVTPKENYKEARDKAEGGVDGKVGAEARSALAGVKIIAKQVDDQIDDILNDPNLDGAVGSIQGRLPSFTQGSVDFDKKLERLQGQAFLQAREFLKGQGQITDFESKRAETAIAQLSTAQSEEQFKDALRNFKDAVATGIMKAEAAANQRPAPAISTEPPPAPPAPPAPPSPPSDPGKVRKYNPATGLIE